MIKKTEEEIMKLWKYKEPPLVSCLTTTYNHEKYIAQCLDSMLMQETDFPFEIIVRDDCSTDKTASIIHEYAKKFPTIIKAIFETENKFHISPHYGGRLVLKKAVGKYICKLDGDDYWRDKKKLQKQADFLETHEAYVLTYFNFIHVDENGQQLSGPVLSHPKDYLSEEMLCSEVYILPNTVMFRNVLKEFPTIFDNVMNGDNVHWHLLGFHGKAKYQEGIEPSAYRIHAGGVWSSLDIFEQFQRRKQLFQAMKKNLKGNNVLMARIDNSMHIQIASNLLKSIQFMDIGLFTKLIRDVREDKEICAFKVLKIFVERLFLKIFSVFSGNMISGKE